MQMKLPADLFVRYVNQALAGPLNNFLFTLLIYKIQHFSAPVVIKLPILDIFVHQNLAS